MSVDPELLEILVCPACRGELREPGPEAIDCDRCGRRYPIRDGIPVMLPEEARELSSEEIEALS